MAIAKIDGELAEKEAVLAGLRARCNAIDEAVRRNEQRIQCRLRKVGGRTVAMLRRIQKKNG